MPTRPFHSSPEALGEPDLETIYQAEPVSKFLPQGWYWRFRLEAEHVFGSTLVGPFDTESEAIADARGETGTEPEPEPTP